MGLDPLVTNYKVAQQSLRTQAPEKPEKQNYLRRIFNFPSLPVQVQQ
jgi:hypothetical protein